MELLSILPTRTPKNGRLLLFRISGNRGSFYLHLEVLVKYLTKERLFVRNEYPIPLFERFHSNIREIYASNAL